MITYTHRGKKFNAPETREETSFKYRGYVIEYAHPPISKPWADWHAYNPENEEEPILFSGLISDLQAQIDERIDGRDREGNADVVQCQTCDQCKTLGIGEVTDSE